MDLEPLKREREAKVTEGSSLAPPTYASGESTALLEAAGGTDAAPGEQETRTGKEVSAYCEATQDGATTTCKDATPAEHPPVARDCATIPRGDALVAENAAVELCFATPCSATPRPARPAEIPEITLCSTISCYTAPCCAVSAETSVTAPSCCETVQLLQDTCLPGGCACRWLLQNSTSHYLLPGTCPPPRPWTLQSPVCCSAAFCDCSLPNCPSSFTPPQGHPAPAEAGLPIALPTAPVQGFDQCLQEPSTTPATKSAPGLPHPETEWASFKTTPQIQATWGMAAPLTQPPWGMVPPPTQPLWGVAPPLIQPSWAHLENASPGVPGDMIPRSEATVPSTLCQSWSWPWNTYWQWTQGMPAEKDRTIIPLWNIAILPPSLY